MNFGFVNWLCLYSGIIRYDAGFEREADEMLFSFEQR